MKKISISERYNALSEETKRAIDNVATLLAKGENEVALSEFNQFCDRRKIVAWEVLALKDLVIFKLKNVEVKK